MVVKMDAVMRSDGEEYFDEDLLIEGKLEDSMVCKYPLSNLLRYLNAGDISAKCNVSIRVTEGNIIVNGKV